MLLLLPGIEIHSAREPGSRALDFNKNTRYICCLGQGGKEALMKLQLSGEEFIDGNYLLCLINHCLIIGNKVWWCEVL